MRNEASKLSIDIVLQALVVVPMLICYVLAIFDLAFIIGALLTQLAVGGVQLMSGLLFSVTRQSKWHQQYLGLAIVYLVFLGIVLGGAGSSGGDATFFVVGAIFNCFIPVCIAIWYLRKSYSYHQNYVAPTKKAAFGEDDLLDDGFLAQ